MPIVKRLTKGSALTHAELDGNFTELEIGRITAAQAAGVAVSASAQVLTMTSIARSMLGLAAPQLQPIPARTAPYRSSGTVRYVDFTYVPGVAPAGTYTAPYNSSAGIVTALAAMVAGDALLFRAGTTSTLSAAMAAVSGTSAAVPIVFGVYDGGTGAVEKRLFSRQGVATINCAGLGISAISMVAKNFTEVDGLNFTNNSGANWFVTFSGTSSGGRITNCTATGGQYHFAFQTTGLNPGHVMENNRSVGATEIPIAILLLGANDNNSVVQFNYAGGFSKAGIIANDNQAGLYDFSGTVACNSVEDGTDTTTRAGIDVSPRGGSPRVFRNTSRRNCVGIQLASSNATTTGSFAGALIENNDCSNNEFGIAVVNTRGALVIQYNRCIDSGSKTGATFITPLQYGRNIELYGNTEAIAVRDAIIRFNYCAGAYNWPGTSFPGSEGTGIGLDDNSANLSVYGNYCVANEGGGIQVNSGHGNRIYSNICVDNNKLRPGRSVAIADSGAGQITFVNTPFVEVFNNTCVGTGLLYQKYGIVDSSAFGSSSARIYNNLCIGGTVAGIARNVAAGTTSENNNVVVGSPAAVVNTSNAVIANGAGTSIQTAAAVGAVTNIYQPLAGGPCDGTGATVPGEAVAFDGQPLASRTPIGALFPAVAA